MPGPNLPFFTAGGQPFEAVLADRLQHHVTRLRVRSGSSTALPLNQALID